MIVGTIKTRTPAGFWGGKVASSAMKVRKSIWVPITKIDEMKRLVTGIVLQPEVTDAQGDILDADVIEKAAHDFLADYNQLTQIGQQHKMFDVRLDLVESWTTPLPVSIGSRLVRKGAWLMTTRVVDDKAWDLVLAGKLRGYSIGGVAKVSEV